VPKYGFCCCCCCGGGGVLPKIPELAIADRAAA